MIKNTVVALVAAATLVGAAAPASAETEGSSRPNAFYNDVLENTGFSTSANIVLSKLRNQGINAVSVENWGGLIRADVVGEDGRQVVQFFAPDTLQQVAL